jgi:PadR family transcriptional regulator AphA
VSLRHALLGLLAREQASGYELTAKFDRLRRFAWHASHSQVYPELGLLALDGLIEVVDEGPRGRRTYAITEAGTAELRTWLLSPGDDPVVRNEFALRLFLLSSLGPEDSRQLLTQHAEQSAREATRLRGLVSAHDAAPDDPPGLPFGRFAAEYGLRYYEMVHEWARWAMAQLDEGQREGAPGT